MDDFPQAPDDQPRQRFTGGRFVLYLLIALLGATTVWFLTVSYDSYHDGELQLARHHTHRSSQPGPDTVNDIQPWMPFSYVNFNFHLPSSYLQDTLHITDPRYPKVRIDSYAKSQGESTVQVTKQVQQAIRQYLGT